MTNAKENCALTLTFACWQADDFLLNEVAWPRAL
jgi:hypothetical protein